MPPETVIRSLRNICIFCYFYYSFASKNTRCVKKVLLFDQAQGMKPIDKYSEIEYLKVTNEVT